MGIQSPDVDSPLYMVLSPRLLLVHHVAKRLCLSRRMVRHLAQIGELRARKVGRKIWHFFPEDIEEFKKSREARYA